MRHGCSDWRLLVLITAVTPTAFSTAAAGRRRPASSSTVINLSVGHSARSTSALRLLDVAVARS